MSLLRSAEENIQKIRQVLRYLVSFVNEFANDELDIDEVTYDELEYMDQYMLVLLHKFQKEVINCETPFLVFLKPFGLQVTEHYDTFAYHRVMMKTVHFVTVNVSAHYLSWIKDR